MDARKGRTGPGRKPLPGGVVKLTASIEPRHMALLERLSKRLGATHENGKPNVSKVIRHLLDTYEFPADD